MAHKLRISLPFPFPSAKPIPGKPFGDMPMSSDINNFLQSMVEAKTALDAMPELRRELEHLKHQVHIQGETIANRELHIHNLKQSEQTLTQKLRSVEAERDDAGFRHLESEDKVQALLKSLHSAVAAGLETISAVSGEGLVVAKAEDQRELTLLRHDIDVRAREVEGLNMELTETKDHAAQVEKNWYEAESRASELKATLDAAAERFKLPEFEATAPPKPIEPISPVVPLDESGQSAGFSVHTDPTTQTAGPTTPTEEVQAQPDGPFASSSDGEGSQTAGEGVQGNASSTPIPNSNDWVTKLGPTPSQPKADPPSDDYWPIPSRASHNS